MLESARAGTAPRPCATVPGWFTEFRLRARRRQSSRLTPWPTAGSSSRFSTSVGPVARHRLDSHGVASQHPIAGVPVVALSEHPRLQATEGSNPHRCGGGLRGASPAASRRSRRWAALVAYRSPDGSLRDGPRWRLSPGRPRRRGWGSARTPDIRFRHVAGIAPLGVRPGGLVRYMHFAL